MRTLHAHEAIGFEELCIQDNWQTLEEASVWIAEIFSADTIHLYWQYNMKHIKQVDRDALLKNYDIQMQLGISLDMYYDADNGEYDTQEKVIEYFRTYELLDNVRFSKDELRSAIKALAHALTTCTAGKEPAPPDDKAGQGDSEGGDGDSDTQAKVAQRIYAEIDRLGSINTEKAKSLWKHCTVFMKVWYEGKKKGDMIKQYGLDKSKGIRRAKKQAEKHLYDSPKGPQIEPRLYIAD